MQGHFAHFAYLMDVDTLNAGYYTSSYTLPQVFFGKDLIGGYEEIHGKHHSMYKDLST